MPVRRARRTVSAGRRGVWCVLADPARFVGCLPPGTELLRADRTWPATGSVLVASTVRARPVLLTVVSSDEPAWLHLLVGRWPCEEVVRIDLREDGPRTGVAVDRTPTGVRLRSGRTRLLQDLGCLARLEEECARPSTAPRASQVRHPARTLSRWA